MSGNSQLAVYGLIALLFLAALIAPIFTRVALRRSTRPLRFKYRLQIFGLSCLTSGWIGCAIFRPWGNHFDWKYILAFASFAVAVAIIGYQLHRQRSLVLAEVPRQVSPLKFPPLLWPIVVVLLPLLVLGVMAVWTLNSDRRSARQEAKARADEIAASVMALAESDFKVIEFKPSSFLSKGRDIITVNHNYELVQPRPWVWPPQPAPLTEKNFSNLRSNKLAQWSDAEKAFAAGEWKRAADLYLAFLDGRRQLGSQPMADFHAGIADSRFRPIALSRRAAALEKSGDVPGAIATYNDIFDGFVIGPQAVAESGVSLAPIAVLKILDLAKDNPEALPEDWKRNPSFLVSEIAQNGPASPIAEEAIRRLRQVAPALMNSSPLPSSTNALFDLWDSSAEGRRFYAAAMAQMGTNAWPIIFWVNGPEPWLVVKQTPPADWPAVQEKNFDETFYAFIGRQWLVQQLSGRLAEMDRREDFVASIEIAGEMLTLSAPSGAKELRELAEVQTIHSASLPITFSIALKDPATYYRAVHWRQFLFSTLVIGALLAGLLAALILRRSLLRQQSLNEQKSNFVSSVSHELRAPIASVRLMAESLERGKVAEGAKQAEYYRFIVQECRRLSALIENVLDFSRIEQGRKQYEFEPTDVLALTRETVKLMEPYAEEKEVQLKLQTSHIQHPTSNIELEMDGRAVQQALVNLIDNAIKHSAKGQTVTVGVDTDSRTGVSPVADLNAVSSDQQIKTTNLETGKMPVLLWVEDRGPGIPAAEHEKIFERFYRLGSELRRETQGVGIGLSIVRHIVAAHGGKVTVRSSVGEGSRFTIVLPTRPIKTRDRHE